MGVARITITDKGTDGETDDLDFHMDFGADGQVGDDNSAAHQLACRILGFIQTQMTVDGPATIGKADGTESRLILPPGMAANG